jgi:hypothetical protein
MAFVVLTKKYAEAAFRLPLTSDGTAYLLCKPVLATKLSEISRQVMAEVGFDAHIAAAKLPAALLESYVIGWHGLQDMNGAEIKFSTDMLKEVCEADPDFAAQTLERLRRIAREAHLEEQKN